MLVKPDNTVELADTVDVAINDFWFDDMLVPVASCFKDLFKTGSDEVALKVKRGPHEVPGRNARVGNKRHLIRVEGFVPAKGRSETEGPELLERDRDPRIQVKSLHDRRCGQLGI